MANISDCNGKVSFIFKKMNDDFEEVNEEVNKEDEMTQEEKLKIVNTFCEIVNKKTAYSDYNFYMPEYISLNDFSKDGNIYNLNFLACGRWALENNFDEFISYGFLHSIIKKTNIIKNLIIEFVYNEYECGSGLFNIDNKAIIKYNNSGESSVDCLYGSSVDITLENLSEYGFECEVEYQLESLSEKIFYITENIKQKILNNDFEINNDIEEIESQLDI